MKQHFMMKKRLERSWIIFFFMKILKYNHHFHCWFVQKFKKSNTIMTWKLKVVGHNDIVQELRLHKSNESKCAEDD